MPLGSPSSSEAPFTPPRTGSTGWIPRRVSARTSFSPGDVSRGQGCPAQLAASGRDWGGTNNPPQGDTQLPHRTHDPPASPSHGTSTPRHSPNPTRGTDRQTQVWRTAGHSWRVSAVGTSSGGQGGVVTHTLGCPTPPSHVSSALESNPAARRAKPSP